MSEIVDFLARSIEAGAVGQEDVEFAVVHNLQRFLLRGS